jgi:hypothetical protein
MDALVSLSNRQGPQTVRVKVADLSQSGIRVYVGSRIARGTVVSVKYKELNARGVVWHSRRYKEGYSAGIEFHKISCRHPSHLPIGNDLYERTQ